MPKGYEYQGDKFSAETLVGMMGEEFIETPVAEVDALVAARDKGAAQILSTYRANVLGVKG